MWHRWIMETLGSIPRSLKGEGGLQGHFLFPRADVVGWVGGGRQPRGLE